MGYKLNIVGVLLGIAGFYTFIADNFNADDVIGKNVVITGATSGIGKGLALEYAKLGANVFITARKEDILKQVVEECKQVGRPNAVFGYFVADMIEYQTVATKVIQAAVVALGGIDHLVLNHALLLTFRKWQGNQEDFDAVDSRIKVNYLSYVHLASHALPYLNKDIEQPGRISIVGSMGGKLSLRSGPSYCGSKFALDGFFSSLRELFEFSGQNITVTYSVIGPVLTEKVKETFVESKKDPSKQVDKSLIDGRKMMIMMGYCTVEDVSMRIVKATTIGQPELYYPHLFGFIPNGYKLFIILRHLWPSLLYCS